MTQAKFVVLKPSNIVMDVNNIAYILRQEVGKYMVIPKQVLPGMQVVPLLDGNDLDALIKAIGAEVVVAEKPEEKKVEVAKA